MACLAFALPWLSEDTVARPDIVLASDLSKLSETGYDGVPAVIIEVLPPGTLFPFVFVDRDTLYENYRVKFWAIDPVQQQANLGVYDEKKLKHHVYRVYDSIIAPPIAELPFLPGFFIDFRDILIECKSGVLANWRNSINNPHSS